MADSWRESNNDEELRSWDRYSHARTVMDSFHRLIHDGMVFETSGKDTAWANGTSHTFLLDVPAGCYPHVQEMILIFGRGDIDFVAYEGCTASDNGTALTSRNVNRNSSRVPVMGLYAEPTITDNGTELFNLWVPPTSTGTGQSANGVKGTSPGSEWILKTNTKYLVILTNNSGTTIDWAHEFLWYEIGYEV